MTNVASRLHRASVAPAPWAPARLVAKAAWLTLAAAARASGHRGAARSVVRYWGWQLGRRVRDGVLELELNPQGVRFRVPAWSQIGGTIVANGSHESSETSFFTRTLRRGDVSYDVGANVGLYTVLAVHAGGRVVTFEPEERAGGALHANVSLARGEDLADTRSVALADHDGEAPFTTGMEVGNHQSGATDGDGDVTAAVCRLDILAADGQLLQPMPGCRAFLQVDAEGHDLEVLRGATDLLRQHRPVVMVETWAGVPATWAGRADSLAIPARQLPNLEARLTASSRAVAVAPPTILGWTES